MRCLLDTHVIVWSVLNDVRLKPALRAFITGPDHRIFFSYASVWELSIKLAQGRLVLPGHNVDSLLDLLRRTDITLLPVRLSHLRASAALPFHHGDPFDRMIAVQAIVEDLTLVTEDTKLRLYNVNVFPR